MAAVVAGGEESAHAGAEATRDSPIVARTTSSLARRKGWVRVDVTIQRPPWGCVGAATDDDVRGSTSRPGGRRRKGRARARPG